MSGRRAIVLVIDALGVGALPDAARYGDEGTNTLSHLAAAVGGLELPTMERLGLGSVTKVQGLEALAGPGLAGRLHALGAGKDSISGHWELMGVVLDDPLPTYPEGFPQRVVERLTGTMGHEVICNRPDNGLAAIEEFGTEHLRSGALILYTSQDSVLQLAAHVDRLAPEELYDACRRAREAMSGADSVGRVIARPFEGETGAFTRTDGRRDFALAPPTRSYLEELEAADVAVHGVGKIHDLFAGRGVSASLPGATNARAMRSVAELVEEVDEGLVFANLIETDQVFGHRKDVEGFHRALREIDGFLAGLIESLRPSDLLIVTADHGVDPAHPGTDHTREHVPLLAIGAQSLVAGSRHEGPMADVGASVLRWLANRDAPALPGDSFLVS
ncbi:MAG TPA: phosphopentomutase [Solirubrobacteraceae bacterium]|jgi:phosphopentomutase